MTQLNPGGWRDQASHGGYHSGFAQPTFSVPVTQSHTQISPIPVAAPKLTTRSGDILLFFLFAGMGVFLLLLVAYFLLALGPVASTVGLLLALIPLGVVVFVVYLIDRWEPEPKRLLVFSVAWGAIAAVSITLLVGLAFEIGFGGLPDEIATVIQAPIVEELAKGFGLLLLFWIARNAFDGPVDGVVYGALIGAGFAFTENIQYFAISLIEGGGESLTVTFIVRAIFSPFAHAMFTGLLGYCLGLAARQGTRGFQVTKFVSLGLLGAVSLHAFWNASAVFGDFFALYITLQVPLFVATVLGVVALRREESRLTHSRLSEYAAAGWFTPGEVDMFATRAGRKAGIAWAGGLRENRTALMREFIKDATALAALRQRVISGRGNDNHVHEQALLARIAATRAALLSV